MTNAPAKEDSRLSGTAEKVRADGPAVMKGGKMAGKIPGKICVCRSGSVFRLFPSRSALAGAVAGAASGPPDAKGLRRARLPRTAFGADRAQARAARPGVAG